MTVMCDVCKKTVDDFNGGVTLAAGWGETIRADACSVKCVIALLTSFAMTLEARGDKIAADNAAFAKAHPEAAQAQPAWDTKKWGMIGPPPTTTAPVSRGTVPATSPAVAATAAVGGVDAGLVATTTAQVDAGATPKFVAPVPLESRPALTGCAACDAGTPMNAETAFKHTGEGTLCQGKSSTAAESGPCSCEPTNWKMEHPPEVTCLKCGNCWTAKLKSADETTTGGRKGRPRGSKNKKTLEAEAAAAAATVPATTNGGAAGYPAETPENKAARDAAMGRMPETNTDEAARLRASRNGQVPVVVNSSAPLPGENVGQLLTDAAKLGVTLNLVDVMKWTSMQRDLLRGWVTHPEHDLPEFLASMGYIPIRAASVQMPPMQVPPAAPVASQVATAAPRFTF